MACLLFCKMDLSPRCAVLYLCGNVERMASKHEEMVPSESGSVGDPDSWCNLGTGIRCLIVSC